MGRSLIGKYSSESKDTKQVAMKVGDRLEIMSDAITDKAPCNASIVAVTEKTITVSYGDEEETFDITKLKVTDSWESEDSGSVVWKV